MTVAIVAGALANKPHNGGNAWVAMSWAVGLRRLGFDVHFMEEIDPAVCVDAESRPVSAAESVNFEYFSHVTKAFAMPASLTCKGRSVGESGSTHFLDVAASAALLINISGNVREQAVLSRVGCRLFLDLDPGFTQAWHAGNDAGARLLGHDAFATIGERIGQGGCAIPTNGLEWIPTRQPVVLDDWPLADVDAGRGFTTIARWRCPYGAVDIAGERLTLKHQQMRRFLAVATESPYDFEMAVDIDSADSSDRALLLESGWRVVDARSTVAEPHDFREYVRTSTAEFSAAQGVYASTRCGWLSDRSARYLAMGRPVVVQDTGTVLPTGTGLVTFRTLDEARTCTELVMRHLPEHRRAARALAEEYLESGKVIGALLDRIGISS